MNFVKMHGLGNDFILIDGRKEKLEGLELKQLAREMCDRHFGAGADGLLIIWPSEKAHYRMQIFNPDGSEAEMCGNGIRCFARYVYEADKLQEEIISVETPAGIMLPAVILDADKKVVGVEVDMGIPEKIKNEKLKIKDSEFEIHEISMGNPHAVIFVNNLSEIDLTTLGPLIENHPNFPSRTNVEFVKVINGQELELLVWERGAGETLACGTGACAAVFASGLSRAIAHLPGGDLEVEINEQKHILLRGPAARVFEGNYRL